MEALLVRFEKSQRSVIRKQARKFKISEAEYVRRCVDYPVKTMVEHYSFEAVFGKKPRTKSTRSTTESNAHQKENGDTSDLLSLRKEGKM